jgi:hypothetical protein
MTGATGSAAHWDSAYDLGDATRSWFQDSPVQSLHMFDAADVGSADSVIDVGGGASTVADALLMRGFADLTVLDISAAGLRTAQQGLGEEAERVEWLVTDLLTWQPQRIYRVWHDRALFHFLTTTQARKQYADTLRAATEVGSVAVFGCFALDGPQSCSGLPVARYDAHGLAEELGTDWTLIAQEREGHLTPTGGNQPFTWGAFRRQS